MGWVKVLPCVPPELYFFTAYHMHVECFLLELPALYLRSPGNIATKKYE